MPRGITYKKTVIKTAKELGYGDDVIARLRNAESDSELEHIMADARKSQLMSEE